MVTKLSKDNQKVKFVRSVTQYKKTRNENDLFTVEGATLFKETPSFLIKEVYVREGDIDLLTLAEEKSENVYTLDETAFKSISDVVAPSGILALVQKPVKNSIYGNKIMVLDGIQDPGNAGTIIRSAAGFKYDTVILVDSVEAFSPKVVRSSMGAIFKVSIQELSRQEAINNLSKYPIFALDMDGKDIRNFDFPGAFALVVGNEAQGISEEFISNSKQTLSIKSQGIESLNASVAASIAMFASTINQ